MTPLGVTGMIMVIIGVIATVIAIILLIINSASIFWWIWLIFALGIILIIIGAVLWIIDMRRRPTINYVEMV